MNGSSEEAIAQANDIVLQSIQTGNAETNAPLTAEYVSLFYSCSNLRRDPQLTDFPLFSGRNQSIRSVTARSISFNHISEPQNASSELRLQK